jgi:hypothetical protein
LDAGCLERGADLSQRLCPRLGGAAFEVGDCLFRNAGVPDEVFLRPIQQGTGGAALGGSEWH